MSIAAWNIRGLNWPNKQEEVKIFLNTHSIGLIGLLETKVKLSKVDMIANNIFPGWRWISNFDMHHGGRVWVAWKPSLYDVRLLSKAEQYVHCEVNSLSVNRTFHMTFVYGHNLDQHRASLWEDLANIADNMSYAWCCLGDFNALLNANDRVGGNPVEDTDIQELQTFMQRCEVFEPPSSGPYYSWTNKTIRSRLDRVFINHWWHDCFDYTLAKYLPQGLSDHTPVLLHFPATVKPRTSFQFCDMWTSQPEFDRLVLEALPRQPSAYGIIHVLNQLRPKLRALNRQKFGDLKDQQFTAREKLLAIQTMLHQAPNDPVLVRQEQHAKEHYTKILSSSLALIRQQCKLDWLKFGDDSTRFFYAQAKCRKLATYVYSLQSTTGTTLEGFDQVGREMLQYYKQLLGQESMVAPSQIETSLANQGPRLTPEQQVALCRPFTPADIKEALFSIPNHKSPGPDGYSSGFFKHTWQHTGALLCDLVDGFFRTGSLPHQVSATKLVLLPKKDYPQTATDFCPISCCNVLYKIIAKLLSWRMKEVLPSIIDPCQGAFVPGRELLYNVLICQDLARGYQRRHITPRCMLKVDLRKAFDSVHWTFLQQ